MSDFSKEIRKDFPILNEKVNGKQLIYLDNGATSQKPLCVIEKEAEFYNRYNANIHRGVHYLSDVATNAYENARETVCHFLNAASKKEIIFTKGTTDSINLVAFSFGEKYVKEGDEIIVTELEHHSNIVPWQLMCQRKNAVLKVLPINDKGELIVSELENIITNKTRLIAVSHVSNTLGTINPVKKITEIAHKHNVLVLIDGAQAVQHMPIDVQKINADFYVFSGHKMYAPTGIGVLYGKENLLDALPPYQGGGDMVDTVSFEKTTFAELPFKFEAGTTNYVGATALATAINYLKQTGYDKIEEQENILLKYATEKLKAIEGLTIFGCSEKKTAVISFIIKNIHSFDIGTMLDKMGIAVRTGTHCTQPLMDRLGIDGTIRASFTFYNTIDEIDKFVNALIRIKSILE